MVRLFAVAVLGGGGGGAGIGDAIRAGLRNGCGWVGASYSQASYGGHEEGRFPSLLFFFLSLFLSLRAYILYTHDAASGRLRVAWSGLGSGPLFIWSVCLEGWWIGVVGFVLLEKDGVG